MQIIRTKNKRKIRQSFSGMMQRSALAALIIGPVARPETAETWVITLGVLSTVAFALLGYLFDGNGG